MAKNDYSDMGENDTGEDLRDEDVEPEGFLDYGMDYEEDTEDEEGEMATGEVERKGDEEVRQPAQEEEAERADEEEDEEMEEE